VDGSNGLGEDTAWKVTRYEFHVEHADWGCTLVCIFIYLNGVKKYEKV